ncbi:cyclic AMP-responsive element-binding protein 3-like protein 4 [Cololabis saira]|uniref:cyclic AMP-responsive element-binding protein 3-like protein 4 n=1 Tax=Cololabis saira TaxID=129043 RepID=UPI002AD4E153|nr:cyclic AMP-responsive element-binding protein 3-like protein 4 [Cololabis saira]XP_061573835.1 cyclic AMP-responsive element-binding protein 3-like protein 4 [Cololabis saira]XP_061573836.1 cyclic AMP-responsive element-binding protein 3-like protein 4 [Cololabis saira]XP_061573837.1 cyclic AMP-responsive element-binding protein 3-like protein 4 [Cololabis saira]XP_061573838.1 cyclic AMP-responsive element-binding protein 3-like protein 4 [Cololabis saira]XP_061573839.1 cyclic AMP-responsiv
MDAESVNVLAAAAVAGDWPLDAPVCLEEPLQDWVVDPECALADSEPEDVLQAVDPNEVFGLGAEPDLGAEPELGAEPSGAEPESSESDSGDVSSSEEPVVMATSQATVYQVVYDITGLGGAEGRGGVVSIQLGGCGQSPLLLPDACVVHELPELEGGGADGDPSFPDLRLTEEEQQLLIQEGVSLPPHLPLTKAEERVLKRVRRKIRNKQSAQDSRRRRKEYVDGLEGRAAACLQQNRDLRRTVEQLETRNTSLLSQLQQLQTLIRRTASKGAQTSTCLLIILVSLVLIILPSFSPFSRLPSTDDDLRPRGVVSRNILTDPSSYRPDGDGEEPPARADPADPAPPPELGQSRPPETPVQQEPGEEPEHAALEDTAQVGNQPEPGNGSAAAGPTGPTGTTGLTGGPDAAKPAHADEM